MAYNHISETGAKQLLASLGANYAKCSIDELLYHYLTAQGYVQKTLPEKLSAWAKVNNVPVTQARNSILTKPPFVVPDAPTGVTATAGNAQASVSFTAPVNTGSGPITGYKVVSSPGGIEVTGASSPIIVTGLTNGVAYTFSVAAQNSGGYGAFSAASNSVTPTSTIEYVTNGDFSVDSGWTKKNGWTIDTVAGKANRAAQVSTTSINQILTTPMPANGTYTYKYLPNTPEAASFVRLQFLTSGYVSYSYTPYVATDDVEVTGTITPTSDITEVRIHCQGNGSDPVSCSIDYISIIG